MKPLLYTLAALALSSTLTGTSRAGTISYLPIPSTNSDAGSGISADNSYTSAVDGGNATGTDRVINGITFTALSGTSNTSTADNITLNALNGSLNNGVGGAGSIAADGALADTMKDMTFNDGAADGSQQEIVLDPASLVAGTTYDLRVYICNSSGMNRDVNLSFACDGQAPVETGWFNEDDATTSGGRFADRNQVYYINYRFVWDGSTTPGITVTQKAGAAPFCLYALTNQVVAQPAAAAEPQQEAPAAPPVIGQQIDAGGGVDVGVMSTDFENNDSLNQHGRWISVGRYGRCWQPSGVAVGWRPYTCGHWVHANCGWTWVSDEQEDSWGWACYHYGRWCHAERVGWCWVPGRVWGPAWVSWRSGSDTDCSCVGWAPLPPEATCAVGVGISTWVDSSYGIGPGYYNFCSIRNFGAVNLSRVCYPPQENVTLIRNTTNVTNIVNNNTTIYNGGPNVTRINTLISQSGGQAIPSDVMLRRNIGAGPVGGGRYGQLQGNTLTMTGPRINPTKNVGLFKPVAETIKTPTLDKGWSQVKDPKLATDLKKHIADESKGRTPQNSKAQLPQGVTLKTPEIIGGGATGNNTAGANPGFHPGRNQKNLLGSQGTQGIVATPTPGGKLHPGQKFQGTGLPGVTGVSPTPAPGALHPGQAITNAIPGAQPSAPPGGRKGKGKNLPVTGQPTPGAAGIVATPTPGALHPGQAITNAIPGAQPSATPGGRKGKGKNLPTTGQPTPGAAGIVATPTPGALHPGQAVTNAIPGAQPSATPGGRKGKGKNIQSTVQPTPAIQPNQPLNIVPGTVSTPTPAATPAGRKGKGKAIGQPTPPVQTFQPQQSNPVNPVQPTPTPKHTGGATGQTNFNQQAAAAAAAKQQEQAAAAAAAKQQQQAAAAAAAKHQQEAAVAAAAKHQQEAAAAAAAKQQQQAAAAAAAKQQQQSAAVAAAKHQQEAAAAAAARQQQQQAAAAAAAAQHGGGKKPAGSPTPTPTIPR